MTAPVQTPASETPATPAPETSINDLKGEALAEHYMAEVGIEDEQLATDEELETAEEVADEPEPNTGEGGTEPAAGETPAAKSETPKPDGETPPTTPPEGTERAPVIKFRTVDAAGQAVELPKDVRVVLEVKGEERVYPLDVAMRLARQGIASSRVAQEHADLQVKHEQVMGRLPELRAIFEQQDADLRALLEDPDAYHQRREEYLKQNTPEERLRRREDADREAAARRDGEAALTRSAETFQKEVLPTYLEAIQPYVETLGHEAITDRMASLTAHLRGANGQTRPENMARVKTIIEQHLVPWMEARYTEVLAEKRSTASAADKKVAEAVRAEQEQRTRDKKPTAAALRPRNPRAAASGASGGPTRPPTPPKNAQESTANSITRHIDKAFSP